MIIFWRGQGVYIPLIMVAVAAPIWYLGYLITGKYPVDQPDWISAIMYLLSGAVLWKYGRHLHRNLGKPVGADRTVVDRRRHDLFFIRVEHWGAIAFAVGCFALVTSILS